MEKPAIRLPSGREYIGPNAKMAESFEELKNRIQVLDATETQNKLMKYADVNFSNPGENNNTIEMMALYQRALTLLVKEREVRVDGHFGRVSRIAIQAFQRENRLSLTDGMPGIETTKALLSKLSEKGLPSNPMKAVMKNLEITPEDDKNVVRIIKEARKNPLPGSNQYSSYSGSNFDNIEYAYVKQPDGGYYVFGERSVDTPVWRYVYQTDKNFNILDVARVEGGGKISSRKGKILEVSFNPAPIIKKK